MRVPDLPARSALTVPASSPRMLVKAAALAADEVVFDLEDSVTAAGKDDARSQLAEFLRSDPDRLPHRYAVRINGAITPWAARDVQAVVAAAGPALHSIVLPKAERPADVHWLDVALSQLEAGAGLPTGSIGIQAQIEGPAGLSLVDELAVTTPRLSALVFGPGDFTAAMLLPTFDFAVTPDRLDLLDLARWQLAVAARRHGLHVVDGPYPAIGDDDGCRASAERARMLGFDGKWVLHPRQIDVVNAAFSPTDAEVERARSILEAVRAEARGDGRGALLHHDTMIDEATRRWAASVDARAASPRTGTQRPGPNPPAGRRPCPGGQADLR